MHLLTIARMHPTFASGRTFSPPLKMLRPTVFDGFADVIARHLILGKHPLSR